MQGLQVFDSNGSCILDVTDRLTRVLGEFETGTSDGSISDSNLASGQPWYIIQNTSNGRGYGYVHFSITLLVVVLIGLSVVMELRRFLKR